jgi:phage tail-like protein
MISNSNGKLLNYLPAIYHDWEDLRQLLAVFEKILYGEDGQDQREIEPRQSLDKLIPVVDSIATISSLFDADETPPDFLPWLSQWVALTHLEGLSEKRQRKLIAEIVPLYAFRGTKIYLEKMLEFFIPENTTISIEDQQLGGFAIGTIGKSEVGINTRLEHDRPFWFRVEIVPSDLADEPDKKCGEIAKYEKQIRRVIDLAKPAYTMYELVWPAGPTKRKTESTDSSLGIST